ncbi:MAG: zinc-binding dehydrogenase [Planctomycetes bacterium]|nr:zinc-binding dehydrogenase [Planctomycetota bacterium]
MKAVVFHEHGGIDRLRHEEVPIPELRSGEALVRVKACALNHLDIWVREGLRGPAITIPHVSGCDVAGEIADVRGGGAKPGDRVLVAPGICCSRCPSCAAGRDSECAGFRILGFQVDGGYAEYVAVPIENLFPVPAGLDFVQAAALPLVSLTAWHMLHTKAGLRSGEDLLVMGAGSGVGTSAIQIARQAGARILAAAGSETKCARARELGAHETVDYSKEDLAEAVRRFTGGRGVDVVFEHTGGDNFRKGVASLAKGGRLVTCGATGGTLAELDLRYLYARQLSIIGSYMGSRWELHEVLRLAERGALKPVVDRVFPLAEAARAQERMLARENFGKIVLVP